MQEQEVQRWASIPKSDARHDLPQRRSSREDPLHILVVYERQVEVGRAEDEPQAEEQDREEPHPTSHGDEQHRGSPEREPCRHTAETREPLKRTNDRGRGEFSFERYLIDRGKACVVRPNRRGHCLGDRLTIIS
jgi:hypothetical protein